MKRNGVCDFSKMVGINLFFVDKLDLIHYCIAAAYSKTIQSCCRIDHFHDQSLESQSFHIFLLNWIVWNFIVNLCLNDHSSSSPSLVTLERASDILESASTREGPWEEGCCFSLNDPITVASNRSTWKFQWPSTYLDYTWLLVLLYFGFRRNREKSWQFNPPESSQPWWREFQRQEPRQRRPRGRW